uniref:Uncharacterized protein n=1 Tax=viral metagenome TaxID=1070528 RepID=A0A6C0HC91_9ZZZZ
MNIDKYSKTKEHKQNKKLKYIFFNNIIVN